MSGSSAIEWTEATWNPVTGCDRVSPGCARCYALTLAKRLKAMGQPRYQRDGDPKTSGPGFGVTLHPDLLGVPLRWKRPRLIFVNSMSDLFHERIPFDYVDRVYETMALGSRHTFQVLTKRPERALAYYRSRAEFYGVEDPEADVLPNVWLGVSIENARYTWRADVLREIPAAVRFVSAEPLLGSLFANGKPSRQPLELEGIDWLIAGGESGAGHRPIESAWLRELRDACSETETAFFLKQIGGRTPKAGGRELDGRTYDELPSASGPGSNSWSTR